MTSPEYNWEYYRTISKETGRKADGSPLPYGLDFFFGNTEYRFLNVLTKAFLGDQNALTRLGGMRAAEPDEAELLAACSSVTPPYASQITAIKKAIAEPVSLIQGPPGTGKTELILNLISCIHHREPDASIAVVSCNNEAIKNIGDKIEEGSSSDPMLRELKGVFAQLGSKDRVQSFVESLEAAGEDVSFYDSSFRTLDVSFLASRPVFTSTIHSMRKIFRENGHSFASFDYVIVDECSQCSILLGLAAMASAKNITLIGDTKQLPPIYKREKLMPITAGFDRLPGEYAEADGKSFISACEEVFGSSISSVMLDQHYRCHPSIIGFCNEYVYDGRLRVMTPDDGRCRIKVLWYEGDYCEHNDAPDGSGNHNNRQIELFIREELPLLSEKLKARPQLSVCVLAPYRDQLKRLGQRLAGNAVFGTPVLEDEDEQVAEIPQLTIHKAQGRGYDIVYFLTTEDCSYKTRFPWSQKLRMINVAVSRAKKEFRIITSMQWLPEELQMRYAGYTLPTRRPAGKDDSGELMVQKLIAYTAANSDARDAEEGFGLIRSELSSVFDKVPLARLRGTSTLSAPEVCLNEALSPLAERLGLRVGIELPLSTFTPAAEFTADMLEGYDVPAEELIAYREHSRLDTVLFDSDDNIRAVIEVDGGYHRADDADIAAADRKKDIWLRDILGENAAFLRLPTDGSSFGELGAIERLLSQGKALPADHTALMQSEVRLERYRLVADRDQRLTECVKAMSEIAESCEDDSGSDALSAIQSLSYADPENEELNYGNAVTDQYYMCRYEAAYSFEYALIFQLVLKALPDARSYSLLTFGCGSMNDAWALAYARAVLAADDSRYLDKTLWYKGVDAAEWSVRTAVPDVKGEPPTEGAVRDCFKMLRFIKSDFSGFVFRYLPRAMRGEVKDNIIFLPKIINELTDKDFNYLKKGLSSARFPGDEYFICVSHSRSRADSGAERVKRLIDSINSSGDFEVSYDLSEILGLEGDTEPLETVYPDCGDRLVRTDDPEVISRLGMPRREKLAELPPCYIFESSLAAESSERSSIADICPDFGCCGADEVTARLAELADWARRSITKVSQITFQIVRLKRR